MGQGISKYELIIQARDEASAKFKALQSTSANAMSAIERQTGGVVKVADGLVQSLTRLQTVLVALGAGAAVAGIAKTSAELQKLQLSLDSVTGGKGLETMNRLRELSRTLPMGLADLAKGFVKLRANGIEPTDKMMRTLVDTTTALGGGEDVFDGIARALGQIQAKANVSAEEILQLAERGVPAMQILKEELQLTEKQMRNLGNAGISAEKGIAALLAGMDKRFAGTSEKASGMLDGLTTKLKDAAKNFGAAIGNAGFLDYLQSKLKSLLDFANSMAGQEQLKLWAQRISDAFISLGNTVESIIKILAPFAEKLAWLVAEFPNATLVILAANKAFGGLGTALMAIPKAVDAVVASLSYFAAHPAVAAIGAIAGTIYLIVDAWYDAKQAQIEASESFIRSMDIVSRNTLQTAKNLQQFNRDYGTTLRLSKEGNIIIDDSSRKRLQERQAIVGSAEAMKQLDTQLASLGAQYAALGNDAASSYDRQIARTKALSGSAQEAATQVLALEMAKRDAVVHYAEEAYAAQKTYIELVVHDENAAKAKIEAAHNLMNTAKAKALTEYAAKLKEHLATALEMEKHYTDQVKQYNQQLVDIEDRRADAMRNLRQQGMTDTQKYKDDLATLKKMESEVKKLMEAGDVDSLKRAQSIAQKMESMAGGLAQYKDDVKSAASEAAKQTNAAYDLEQKATEALKAHAKEQQDAWAAMATAITDAATALGGVGEKPIEVKPDATSIKAAEDIFNELTKTETKVIEVETRQKGGGGGGEPVPAYATGGVVGSGARIYKWLKGVINVGQHGTDKVLAAVTRGEGIVNKAAMRFYGADFLHAINSMRFPMIPAFADGGVVGGLATTANNISVNVNPFAAESLGSLDLNVGGLKATRVYGSKSALQQLKQELHRENLRGKSGA